MEKRTEHLFYIGIQTGAENGKDIQETFLKTILQFPGGQLVVYGCFVPKALIKPTEQGFRWQRNRRKKKWKNLSKKKICKDKRQGILMAKKWKCFLTGFIIGEVFIKILKALFRGRSKK